MDNQLKEFYEKNCLYCSSIICYGVNCNSSLAEQEEWVYGCKDLRKQFPEAEKIFIKNIREEEQ